MKRRPVTAATCVAALTGLVLLLLMSQSPTLAGDDAPEFVFFFSGNTRFAGRPVPVGAVIRAFDPDGVQCGQWTVGTAGQYGAMSCQRDDPVTVADEGPLPGELVTFTINDRQATAVAVELNFVPVAAGTPVTWTSNGDLWEVDLNVPATANLRLSKSVDRPTSYVGQRVTFRVRVANGGPEEATDVRVTDLLPAGLALVAATPSQGSYNPGTGIWSVGTIAADARATLEIAADVTAFGEHVNLAEVTRSAQVDPNSTPGNNAPGEDDQASATVTVLRPTAVGGYGVPLSAAELLAPWLTLVAALVGLAAGARAVRRRAA